MTSKVAARVFRRIASSGRILSEQEKTTQNIYVKKIENEKLEKLARKGPTPEGRNQRRAQDAQDLYLMPNLVARAPQHLKFLLTELNIF